MVDPTHLTACPACGYRASANQLGQVYPHGGVTGCPYSGTGALRRQGVFPLKFATRPAITAAAAYIDGGTATTIRYDLDDEQRPEGGDYLSLRDVDADPFGIATVERTLDGPLNHVFTVVRDSPARHGINRSQHLVEAMNGYYDTVDIDYETTVTAVFYDPHITDCYRDEPR